MPRTEIIPWGVGTCLEIGNSEISHRYMAIMPELFCSRQTGVGREPLAPEKSSANQAGSQYNEALSRSTKQPCLVLKGVPEAQEQPPALPCPTLTQDTWPLSLPATTPPPSPASSLGDSLDGLSATHENIGQKCSPLGTGLPGMTGPGFCIFSCSF
jgi:hypothetical protein